MENTAVNNPKDGQVTNRDDSVTNKDGDNYLERGARRTDEPKKGDVQVPTATPDNNSGDPGPPAESERNKDEAPGADK
ncbi:hypothetical protein [Mucilaginibacter ginsenosidivorans]|uniref:Uncharacterized protein n=1 Tax=Mucilaginibacter ginsenosidivorans TaxID=398053 RepID=A0A5B8UX94_9SPHI|nr:hypothetical protein [Mucilaginibacter ginsenosidivorans]QEC63528.1 hypothetical protein FRZ54_13385 [Mucilaginibacter ginsenosidivorans]